MTESEVLRVAGKELRLEFAGPPDVERCRRGPLLAVGLTRVLEPDGTAHTATRPVVAVCRCGRSGRPPWCDGSHKRPADPR